MTKRKYKSRDLIISAVVFNSDAHYFSPDEQGEHVFTGYGLQITDDVVVKYEGDSNVLSVVKYQDGRELNLIDNVDDQLAEVLLSLFGNVIGHEDFLRQTVDVYLKESEKDN